MLYLLFLWLLKANGCLFPALSFHSQFYSSFIFCIAGSFQSADRSRRGAAIPALAAWSVTAAAICSMGAQPTPRAPFLLLLLYWGVWWQWKVKGGGWCVLPCTRGRREWVLLPFPREWHSSCSWDDGRQSGKAIGRGEMKDGGNFFPHFLPNFGSLKIFCSQAQGNSSLCSPQTSMCSMRRAHTGMGASMSEGHNSHVHL